MSETTTANLAFAQKIIDTVHDSNVIDGLVSAGILPQTFQSFVGIFDVTQITTTGSAVSAPLLDARTGNQIVLVEGQQVVLLRGGVTEAFSDDTQVTTVQVGLAANASGAIVEALTATATGTVLEGAGLGLTADTNGGVVGDTNEHVVVETNVSVAQTAGELKFFIVVV